MSYLIILQEMDFLPPILLILSRINVLDISKQQNVEILKNCLLYQDTKTERFKCLNVKTHRTAPGLTAENTLENDT